MAIDASFHKNVFLLMQAVPASYECTKHFKKGMFDKPNTSGFLHTSHYLLSVHNAKRFQRMVLWPIMNKTDEKKYRAEIKEYLEIVANENPDISFPPILMSHLLQAGGTKFLIIMWKISEISLRAYITRKCQTELLQAPNIGDNKDIIQTYFTTINLKKDIAISTFCEETELILKTFEQYMKYKSNDLMKLQSDIFKVQENIGKFVPTLPVNPSIAIQLTDTEDTEIINLWKTSIDKNIKFLCQKNANLYKLKTLSNALYNLILKWSTNSKFFDGNDLPKVKSEIIKSLCFTDNIQHINCELYMNGSIIFQTLLLIFHQILKQVEYSLKMNNLSDLSNCEVEIIEHCKTIKSMEETFQKFVEQVSDMLCIVQHSLQEESIHYTIETDFLYPMSLETILGLPKFNFSTSESIDDKKLFKKLWYSPLQGKYKHLFKRYKRGFFNSPKRSATKFQFDNDIENIINWKSPQRLLSYKKNSPNKIKISPRYSRLFSTSDLKRNSFRETNAASTPNPSRICTTPKKSTIHTPNPETINIDVAMKNIFDLSCKITNVVASLSKS